MVFFELCGDSGPGENSPFDLRFKEHAPRAGAAEHWNNNLLSPGMTGARLAAQSAVVGGHRSWCWGVSCHRAERSRFG